jgi:serine protease AprX
VTQLRWTTYDDRGPTWGRARVRVIALTLVFGLTALGALTAASTTGRAEDTGPVATADLTLLEQRHRAEVRALTEAYDRAVARIKAEGDRSVAGVRAALADKLTALEASAAAAASARADDLLTAQAAVRARRSTAEVDLHKRFDADRTGVDVFFQDLLTSLGTAEKIPSSVLDAAKKSLEARRSVELTAQDAAHKAESAALADQVRTAVSALDQQSARLDSDVQAQKSAIDAAADLAKKSVTADTSAAVRQIDADTTALKARHAQEQLDVDAVQAAQTRAAATWPKAQRDALAAKQKSDDDELHRRHEAELAAQAAARKAVSDEGAAAAAAVEAQRQADRDAAETAYRAAKDAVAAQKSATVTDGALRTNALDDAHAAAVTALKNTYAAAITGLSRGRAGVQDGWAARTARVADDESKAVTAVDASTQVELKKVTGSFDNLASAAVRQLGSDRRAATRAADQERSAVERATRKELLRARLDLDRRLRLADSEYFTLKIRAVAFLQDPSAFSSVSAAYDPATDPGSLYNVARRIGADRVPATATGRGVDVALIDTGVVDVPGLAASDVEIGPDFSFEDVVPDLRGRDTMGHGTHLSGIIAGRDAAWVAGDHERRPDRFLGIAPDARLVSVKAGAADGSVDVTQIIAAINWVIANKDSDGRHIRVLNLSFGTDGTQDYRSDPLAYAVERAWRAGIVVVVAAGNDGWLTSRLTNPAQDPFVLAVGSSQAVDGKESVPSAYSNGTLDGRGVDLAAPGRSIVSLRNPGSSSDEVNQGGRTGDALVRASGTSQAAAVTSGAAALLLSARPELTPDQVKRVLMKTATPDDEDADLVGAGYLRVDRAVKEDVGPAGQTWQPSDGSGSLDGARGSVRVALDAIVLEGDLDVFGRSWSGAKWSDDSWTGAKWSSGAWTGAKWSGAKWSSDLWSGTSWTGAKWSSEFWSGAKWSGAKWSADGWVGAKWSGAKWSSGGWFGAGWDDGPAIDPELGDEPVSAEAQSLATTG